MIEFIGHLQVETWEGSTGVADRISVERKSLIPTPYTTKGTKLTGITEGWGYTSPYFRLWKDGNIVDMPHTVIEISNHGNEVTRNAIHIFSGEGAAFGRPETKISIDIEVTPRIVDEHIVGANSIPHLGLKGWRIK
jgi:hypothetical protein